MREIGRGTEGNVIVSMSQGEFHSLELLAKRFGNQPENERSSGWDGVFATDVPINHWLKAILNSVLLAQELAFVSETIKKLSADLWGGKLPEEMEPNEPQE